MRISPSLRYRLRAWAHRKTATTKPNMIIGPTHDAYLLRWYVIPRNPCFNIYLHKFLRSDDDRALHDHPWVNASILIDGNYWEHVKQGGPQELSMKFLREEGFVYFRRATAAHRVELQHQLVPRHLSLNSDGGLGLGGSWETIPVTTLFITGPRIRNWGFLCPKGWRSHTVFLADNPDRRQNSVTGRGCE